MACHYRSAWKFLDECRANASIKTQIAAIQKDLKRLYYAHYDALRLRQDAERGGIDLTELDRRRKANEDASLLYHDNYRITSVLFRAAGLDAEECHKKIREECDSMWKRSHQPCAACGFVSHASDETIFTVKPGVSLTMCHKCRKTHGVCGDCGSVVPLDKLVRETSYGGRTYCPEHHPNPAMRPAPQDSSYDQD